MSESTPVPDGYKKCTRGGHVKPLSEFSRRSDRDAYRSECKTCKAEQGHRWRKANPTYFAAHYRKNRVKKIAAAREYARLNPVDPVIRLQRKRKWRSANADRVAAVNRAWRAVNPDLVRESALRCQNRRRARLRGLPNEPYTVIEILERDGANCVLCGEELDLEAGQYQTKAATIEHLECISWPNSAGDVLSNVALAHWSCNMRRGTSSHPAAVRKRAELLAMEHRMRP